MVKEIIWHRTLRRPYRLVKAIDIGHGPTVIVLVHGLGARAGKWKPLINILDKSKYRIVAYDLLGFGTSPKPSWLDYSINHHVKSLLHSLKKDLGPNAAYVLVGHSMGCIISTHVASKKSSKSSALFLYEPPLLLESNRLISHKKLYEYIASRPEAFVRANKILGRVTSTFSLAQFSDKDWIPIERSIRNTIIAQKTTEELKVINTPTHVIYGRLDFVVSKLDAKKLANINPNIKLHYVTEMHDIKPRSAKYIKKLIEAL